MKSRFNRDNIKQFLQEQSLPIEEVIDKKALGKYAHLKYEELVKIVEDIRQTFDKVGGIENQRFLDYSYSHLIRSINNSNPSQGTIPITLEESILDLIGEEIEED